VNANCPPPCDGNAMGFVGLLFLSFLASIVFAIVGGIMGYRYKKQLTDIHS
jgi:hypothetical protein